MRDRKMNVKELIGKYEYMSHACFRRVDTLEVLKDLRQLDEPQKVTIPQFVADWIKYCKNTGVTLARALLVEEIDLYNYANQKDYEKLKEFLKVKAHQEAFARAWLDGYEVEKEKRYTVVMKKTKQPLYYNASEDKLFFSMAKIASHFTRQQLEKLNFGWVFDCPGIEIEEV